MPQTVAPTREASDPANGARYLPTMDGRKGTRLDAPLPRGRLPLRVICRRSQPMEARSAMPLEADVGEPTSHVGFGPRADTEMHDTGCRQRCYSYLQASWYRRTSGLCRSCNATLITSPTFRPNIVQGPKLISIMSGRLFACASSTSTETTLESMSFRHSLDHARTRADRIVTPSSGLSHVLKCRIPRHANRSQGSSCADAVTG